MSASNMQAGVTLGPVTLSGFEIPERIGFGGSQRLAIHRLPGGGRIVDAMGAEERDIAWSGMMLGPDAADRARRLDALRRGGATVALSFGDMVRPVVVAAFEAEYRGANWIGDYRIRCAVAAPPPVPPDDPAVLAAAALLAVAALCPGVPAAAIAALASGAEAAMAAMIASESPGGVGGLRALAATAETLGRTSCAAGLLGRINPTEAS